MLAGLDGRLRPARAERRAEPRPARSIADRAKFLFGRYPRGADPGGVAARLAIGRAARRALRQEHGDYPARRRAVGLGHRQYAHRRRRHRPGAGADRRAAGLGARRAAGSPGSRFCRASVLDRPRVDVTLRISGFFRDAFPGLIDLFDSAVRAVAALDEPPATNPLAAARRGRPRSARSAGVAARRGRAPRRLSRVRVASRAPTGPGCRR